MKNEKFFGTDGIRRTIYTQNASYPEKDAKWILELPFVENILPAIGQSFAEFLSEQNLTNETKIETEMLNTNTEHNDYHMFDTKNIVLSDQQLKTKNNYDSSISNYVVKKRTIRIAIAQDTRHSSELFYNMLVKGFENFNNQTSSSFVEKIEIIHLGISPSASVGIIVTENQLDGGIMITASHNPWHDNGLKFFNRQGEKLSDQEQNSIEHKITAILNKLHDQKLKKNILSTIDSENDNDVNNNHSANINLEMAKHLQENLFEEKKDKLITYATRYQEQYCLYITKYINTIIQQYIFVPKIELKKKKVILDCANGAAGFIFSKSLENNLCKIFESIGIEVICINNLPNGFNINHNCGSIHASLLEEEMIKQNASFGFAFDGDADRLVALDENGKVINGDCLIASLACFLKQTGIMKIHTVAVNNLSTIALDQFLKSKNINTIRTDVGDRNVYNAMKKLSLSFGGEESGHLLFTNLAKSGDAVLACMLSTVMIIASKTNASECLNPFTVPFTIKVNISYFAEKNDAIKVINGITEKYNDFISKKGGRIIVRPSGTETKIRVFAECNEEEILQDLLLELNNVTFCK